MVKSSKRDHLLDQYVLREAESTGIAVEADWRYRYFFQFLQLSPSYQAAHAILTLQPIDAASALLMPKDIELVNEVYYTFGDVWSVDFGEWWTGTAHRRFGVKLNPSIAEILSCAPLVDTDAGSVRQAKNAIEAYLTEGRQRQGKPGCVVLAIPLGEDRKQTSRMAEAALDAAYEKYAIRDSSASFEILRSKVREKTLLDAYTLVVRRTAFPDKTLWQLGEDLSVSPINDTSKAKSTADIARRRKTMAIMVSERLKRAERFAENAARGKFPSEEPVEGLPFNYEALRRWIPKYKMRALLKAKMISNKLKSSTGSSA